MNTHYIVFERPVGSSVWTQVMVMPQVPYRSNNVDRANDFAIRHAKGKNTCTAVVRVGLPDDTDDSVWARLYGSVDWFKGEDA